MKTIVAMVTSLLIITQHVCASEETEQVRRIIGDERNSHFITYKKGGIEAWQALEVTNWSGGTILKRVVQPGKHIANKWTTDSDGHPRIEQSHWENEKATEIYTSLEREFQKIEQQKKQTIGEAMGHYKFIATYIGAPVVCMGGLVLLLRKTLDPELFSCLNSSMLGF